MSIKKEIIQKMSSDYYFNLDQLSIEVSIEHIKKMTDNNYVDQNKILISDDALENNIKQGFVALTMFTAHVESFINMLVRTCWNYHGDHLIKASIDEKLEILFMHYTGGLKALASFKNSKEYQAYFVNNRVRNELIHYKNPHIGGGTGTPNFKIAKMEVASFFTKKEFYRSYSKILGFRKQLATALGLHIYEGISIFECDAKDDPVHYAFDEKVSWLSDN